MSLAAVGVRTSVVIPTRNYGRFLGAACRSVFGQSPDPPELIVVDDGSTDETPSVVSEFPGIRYLPQPPRGISAARNLGAAVARGDRLCFLDADDELVPGALDHQEAFLSAHAEVDVVVGGWQFVDATGAPLPQTGGVPAGPLTASQIALEGGCQIATTGAALVRRAAFERVGGFDEAVSPAEDLDFWMRVAQSGGRIVGLDRPTVRVRVHGANTSTRVDMMARQMTAVYERSLAQLEDVEVLAAARLYTCLAVAASRWEAGDWMGWRAALLEPTLEASDAWESPATFLRLAYLLVPHGWRARAVLRARSADVARGLDSALMILRSGPSHTPRRTAAGLLAVAELYAAGGDRGRARRAALGAAAACPRVFAAGGGTARLLKSLLPGRLLAEARRVRAALRRARPAGASDA
jgi:hypothetical protein